MTAGSGVCSRQELPHCLAELLAGEDMGPFGWPLPARSVHTSLDQLFSHKSEICSYEKTHTMQKRIK